MHLARGESAAARGMRRGRTDVTRVSRRSPRDGFRQTAVARFTSVCCLVLAGLRRKPLAGELKGLTRQHDDLRPWNESWASVVDALQRSGAASPARCTGGATLGGEVIPIVNVTPCTWPRTTCAARVRQLRRGPPRRVCAGIDPRARKPVVLTDRLPARDKPLGLARQRWLFGVQWRSRPAGENHPAHDLLRRLWSLGSILLEDAAT